MIELVIAILGVWFGWKLREVSAIRTMEKIQKEQEHSRIEQLAEELASKWVEMTVEDQNGVFYAYRKDDGSFLAQGKDAIELSKHLNARFPDKKFTLTKEQLLMIGIYND
jgi:hypothetical protein